MKKKIQKYLSGEREGFSLIELIIVIAIMAILIGVVALVVLPYLESSRESTDRAAMNEVATAFKSAASNATLASEIEAGPKKFDELKPAVQTKINSYLEKKVGDIKFSSTKAKDGVLYFMKDTTRGFVVFIGSSATASSVSDSDNNPFTSDGKPVGGAAQDPGNVKQG